MKKEKLPNGTRLKTWLLNKPLVFAFTLLGLSFLSYLIFGAIKTVFDFEPYDPIQIFILFLLFVLSFALSTYLALRKLPRDKMSQYDFVAITNGASLISIIASFFAILGVIFVPDTLQFRMSMLYMLHSHTKLFFCLTVLLILFSFYLVGVAISGIYAKYLRATTLGISKWKVILSLPFTFLLMWTPGYLLKGKDIKPTLEIKCNWYTKFNKWVLSNSGNILLMFLLLLFCKTAVSGLPTFALSAILLIIYILWYTKHKSDFIKNINNGYALAAVGINITIVLAIIIIYSLLILGGKPY